MIFGFGPAMLAERGWSVAAAGSAVSVVMWLTMLSVPAGGFLADWTKRHVAFIVCGRRPVCSGLGVCRPHRGDDCKFRCPRHRLRAAGRRDHEPAGPRSGAGDTRRRHGHLSSPCSMSACSLRPQLPAGLLSGSVVPAAAFDFGAAAVLCAALLAWVFPMLAASVLRILARQARPAVPGAAKP